MIKPPVVVDGVKSALVMAKPALVMARDAFVRKNA
jgi:hypothetical protein